ncbi:MAG: ATP-dependent Clp protease proteolytic subunit [Opitutales bacterium]|nr:ATP-dependent Clp protease proteolytic subunit [Opitutales bacterium]
MNSLKFFLTIASALAVAPFLTGQETEIVSENIIEESPAIVEAQAAVETAEEEAVPVESETPIAVSGENALPAQQAPESPKPPVLTPEQRKQLEIRLLNARKALLDAELGLARARVAESLAPRNAERTRLETETALRMARSAAKLSEIDAEKRKLDAIGARDKARDDLALLERGNALRAADLDFKITRAKQELTLAHCSQEIEKVKSAEQLRELTPAALGAQKPYRKDPLENGKLYISDRRVEFNGPVTPELAKHITERIYFYNNQNSEYPIFLVIDSSPGGSVAAGYQIIKAMESSKAPVYVVVKSYAASMAAMIATTAERSFCYRDSVLLQHQPSSGVMGNLTQMTEQLKLVTEWSRYINDKLAAKMGLSYEDYVREMYKNNSQGDWTEFGEGAKKWNWVTDIVDTIDESSFVRAERPAEPNNPPTIIIRQHKVDERGKPYFELPTLPAGDAWMIYDPNNLYRTGA